jgi:hypothetical protein
LMEIYGLNKKETKGSVFPLTRSLSMDVIT